MGLTMDLLIVGCLVFLFSHLGISGTPIRPVLVEKLGSERLMWGTDMPNVERFCNYRQTLDTFRVHCAGVIDDRDLENILGRTAADFFNI